MAKAKPKRHPERSKGTPDWNDIERRVRLLSRAGDDGVRIQASPGEILAEAQYLAEFYRKAGLPLPDTLAALV